MTNVRAILTQLQQERTQIDTAIKALSRAFPQAEPKPPVRQHWTRRPENAAKLRKVVKSMTAGRKEKTT